MDSIFVGNPISLILGISRESNGYNFFIVKEEEDLRMSSRNTYLALQLQECIALFFKIPITKISFKEFEELYFLSEKLITEFRYLAFFNRMHVLRKLPRVEALSYGADLLLAESGFQDRFRGPRSYKVVTAWRKELSKMSNLKCLVIPELNKMPKTVAGIDVQSVNKFILKNNLLLFSRSREFFEFSGIKGVGEHKLIVVGPDYLGFDMVNLNAIVSVIRKLNVTSDYRVLIKPHPASDIPNEMIQEFENSLGLQTLNTELELDIERVKTIPLEVFMAANESNRYVGIYTAGVSSTDIDKVSWVPSSNKFAEKMYRINYREFVKRWSS